MSHYEARVVDQIEKSWVSELVFAPDTLFFDPHPSKKINEILDEAIKYLDSHQVNNGVVCGLNGVTLKVRPDMTVEEAVKAWEIEFEKNKELQKKRSEASEQMGS